MNTYDKFESAFFEAFASDLWCRDARFKRARKLASSAYRDGYDKQVKRLINTLHNMDAKETEKYFADYLA